MQGLDYFFALGLILDDVVERRYITAGFAALVLLVPLAITSTKGWIRRLGKRWQKLHRSGLRFGGVGCPSLLLEGQEPTPSGLW